MFGEFLPVRSMADRLTPFRLCAASEARKGVELSGLVSLMDLVAGSLLLVGDRAEKLLGVFFN